MNRRDFLSGLFVLSAGLLLLIGYGYSSLIHFRHGARSYYVEVPSVFGLAEGTAVMMSGYPVGEVRRIEVHTSPALRFVLELRIRRDISIPAGTRAVVTSRALNVTASRIIELRAPAEPGPALEPGARLQGDVEPSLNDVLLRAEAAFKGFSELAQEVQRPLGEGKEPGFRAVLLGIDRNLTEFQRTLAKMNAVMARMDATFETISTSAETISRSAEVLGRGSAQAETTFAHLDATLDRQELELEAVLKEAKARLQEMQTLIHSYQMENNEDLRDSLRGLNAASKDLELFMAALRRSPWRTMRKGAPTPPPTATPAPER